MSASRPPAQTQVSADIADVTKAFAGRRHRHAHDGVGRYLVDTSDANVQPSQPTHPPASAVLKGGFGSVPAELSDLIERPLLPFLSREADSPLSARPDLRLLPVKV